MISPAVSDTLIAIVSFSDSVSSLHTKQAHNKELLSRAWHRRKQILNGIHDRFPSSLNAQFIFLFDSYDCTKWNGEKNKHLEGKHKPRCTYNVKLQ